MSAESQEDPRNNGGIGQAARGERGQRQVGENAASEDKSEPSKAVSFAIHRIRHERLRRSLHDHHRAVSITADLIGCAAQPGMSAISVVTSQDDEIRAFPLGARDDRFGRMSFP